MVPLGFRDVGWWGNPGLGQSLRATNRRSQDVSRMLLLVLVSVQPRNHRGVFEGRIPWPRKLSVPTMPATTDSKKERQRNRHLCLDPVHSSPTSV